MRTTLETSAEELADAAYKLLQIEQELTNLGTFAEHPATHVDDALQTLWCELAAKADEIGETFSEWLGDEDADTRRIARSEIDRYRSLWNWIEDRAETREVSWVTFPTLWRESR